MKIAILGGDNRFSHAASCLFHRGIQVCYYRDGAAPPPGITPSRSLRDVYADADAVILPIPVTRDGVSVFGVGELLLSDLLDSLPRGTRLLGGNVSAAFTEAARRRGIPIMDYLNMDSFVLRNAYLTAQAALGILLTELPYCLYKTKLAILGFGRIGKFLARMLASLGAEVTVFARRDRDLAMASLIGLETASVKELENPAALADMRAVINTAPARLLTCEHLRYLRRGTILLELATGEENFPIPAPASEIRLLIAHGLPGKCFPASAGEIVADATLEALSNITHEG